MLFNLAALCCFLRCSGSSFSSLVHYHYIIMYEYEFSSSHTVCVYLWWWWFAAAASGGWSNFVVMEFGVLSALFPAGLLVQ